MSLISIVSPCYNEEENVESLYKQVKDIFSELPDYQYEHIFIDNASRDNTVKILKKIAKNDNNVKVILNSRNFGHIRSPYYGLLQSRGNASIILLSDLQDPPELIRQFLKKWEEGYKVVMGVKAKSNEGAVMFTIRKIYYKLIGGLSEIELTNNFSGYGLFDKEVIKILRDIDDPYPYFRGLISDVGFEPAIIEYVQSERKKGSTKNNFYTLYDIAMLGITNHSKIPLRLATAMGFSMSLLSMLMAIGYFILKLLIWERYNLGMASLIIGLFFFTSVQLFFIGIIGEYVGAIHTQVLKRPLVIEKERINFD